MNINNEHISKNSRQRKLIYSITPFTLLDYPDKTACILWFAGCNMRCTYCYNPEIVTGKGKYSLNDIKDFLVSRRNLLDAVVLSGGECLLSSSIKDVVAEIKSLGYLIKIDTNGSCPEILMYLIQNRLIDYVALDFKATKIKTFDITKADCYDKFISCLKILINSDTPYEVRTTIHSALLDKNDILEMINVLNTFGHRGKYFIQQFVNIKKTLGSPGASIPTFNVNECNTSGIEAIER